MIKAYAWSHRRMADNLSAEFDAEPFLENASLDPNFDDLLSIIKSRLEADKLVAVWAGMPRGFGLKCLEWTIKNHPTPELISFRDQSDDATSMDVSVCNQDIKHWLGNKKVKKIANKAVNDLMGGQEP